jgi:nicotinic acid mononucleotide adenylyltransferase
MFVFIFLSKFNFHMIKNVMAVFGGSFDPPTMAHALIISELLNKNLAD